MMRWYVHVPQQTQEARRLLAERIRRVLNRPDVVLLDADQPAAESPTAPAAMSTVEAMVIEGTVADADVGFLLAHAMAERTPTLYLYQRGTVAKVLSHLSLAQLPAWIHVVSYHDRSLERHVEEFLLVVGGKSIRPTPRIKFTLRVTSLIEEYLNFKTVNTKTSKADWVREVIERLMAEDPDWQRLVRRRHRSEGSDHST